MRIAVNLLVFFVIGIGFWIINSNVPFVLDDDVYSCKFLNYTPESEIGVSFDNPVCSFKDVIESQIYHYISSNGRSVIHIIVQCFCGIWGKPAYNLLASFLIIILLLLLGHVTCCSNHKGLFLNGFFPLLFFLISLTQPRCLYNGISHGSNYLLSTIFVLSFVSTFNKAINNKCLLIGVFILCFIAGWTHEALVVGLLCGLLVFSFINKDYNKVQLAKIILFGIGVVFLIASPGNFNRLSSTASYWESLCSLLSFEWKQITVLLIAMIPYVKFKKVSIAELLSDEVVWVIAIIASMLFIICSKTVYSRSLFGLDLYMSILTIRVLYRLLSGKVLSYLELSSCVIIISGIILIIPLQMSAKERYSIIESNLQANKGADKCEIVLPSIKRTHGLGDFICDLHCPNPTDYAFESWIDNDFQLKVYKWKYNIEHISIYDNDIVEEIQNVFVPLNKFPGNNCFYNYKSVLISSESLPENVHLSLSLGKYRLNSVINICKALYTSICGLPDNKLFVDVDVRSFEIKGRNYYYINVDRNSSRVIQSIDYEKQ